MSEIKVNSVVNSTGDNDSGLDLSTNDQVIIKTANTTAVTVNSSQVANFANNPTVNSVPYTNAPAFLVKLSGDTNITDATETKVEFDTEIIDTDNKYDNSTNYRFTPTVAGTYFLFAQVYIKSNANAELADMRVTIKKNTTRIFTTRHNPATNDANSITLNVSTIDVANTTDYYEVHVFANDESGNPTIESSENGVTSFFGGYKLMGI